MATLTIRDLDDEVRDKLRVRAAKKGVSMEAEVRDILADAVRDEPRADHDVPGAWLHRLRRRMAETDGYWTDDEVEYVNGLRTMNPQVTFEQWQRDRSESSAADTP